MKTVISFRHLLFISLLFAGFTTMAQTSTSKSTTMKTYLIEREIPDAGKFTPAELKGISQTSCGVLQEMGPQIKWIHSYVVKDKIYCVYQAENEALIREHGSKGGFPVTNIMEVGTTISPATAGN
ncbi:MAG TPA: DUF4242 domain-containing protein [Saprospiraceae bacterium]|nr:DUF4242 domain-containing protein [Saprospiraceae bacterium]